MDIKYNNGWNLEKFLIRFIKMAITIFWILDICILLQYKYYTHSHKKEKFYNDNHWYFSKHHTFISYDKAFYEMLILLN